MARRFILVALALSLSTLGLHAAERATIILNNGQRVSGMLDASQSAAGTAIGLAIGGRLQTFSFDQIAVIDFVGGGPASNEMNALPSGGQMMTMRNGGTRMGYLVAVANGDTVVWQEEGGARRTLPVSQVARIYLNPNAARTAFNNSGRYRGNGYGGGYANGGYNGGSDRNGPYDRNGGYNGNGYQNGNGGYSGNGYGANGYNRRYGSQNAPYGAAPGQMIATNVSDPGNAAWTDSGINVTQGQKLDFNDQGGITFVKGTANNTANAGGKSETKSNNYPVKSAGVGALIGKIGESGTPFYIGAQGRGIAMPASGRLYLGINDDVFADNGGAYSVSISQAR